MGLSLIVANTSFSFAGTQIVDGDTIDLDGTRYRLNGIDAPEYGQKCNKPSGTWPCGKKAVEVIAALTEGQAVKCEPIIEDGFGRTVATCYVNGADIGAQLVEMGLAWAFVKFSKVYVEQESKAKKAGIGIWQAHTKTAWDYRAEKWVVAKQIAPDGCPIKGNVSRNGRIYHAPWSPWYNRTKVSLAKGERWFCNEAEAVAAGWRAPYWR